MEKDGTGPWYHLSGTPGELVQERLQAQESIVRKHHRADQRLEQALEIAVFKALQQQQALTYLGRFPDLTKPKGMGPYRKEEPPSHLGNRHVPDDSKLDFIIISPEQAAIEVKNIRRWVYPQGEEIRALLRKATCLDCVPVMIARRIPYVTFMLLEQCGVVFHQTYNQLMDERDREIAEKARNKSLLGYHDIRIGIEPDTRLLKFIGANLPAVLPRARKKFDAYKNLLADYATGGIPYRNLVHRIRSGP